MVKAEWQVGELLPRFGFKMAEVAVPRTLVAARGDPANSQAFS
ncbi:hypothetical protein [Singulisphaera sp. GP187]|nr:hypothetical protein [Singulisphaera sp. GP187]